MTMLRVLTSLLLVLVAVCSTGLPAQTTAPPPAPGKDQVMAELVQLLRDNSSTLTLQEGKVGGAAADLLIDAGKHSQFLIIAEEHNTQTLPRLAVALLERLQPSGYEYIATESATAHARWASEPPQRGNKRAIFSFIHRYPYAITFYRDAEAQMFADAGRISKGKGHPIWGIDQEFGAEPALEIIVRATPDKTAREYAESLLARAHQAEADRTKLSDTAHFIAVTDPQEWQRLAELYKPVHDANIQWLVHDLIASNHIYNLWVQRRGWANSLEREDYLKSAFMEEYRRAAELDGHVPKVILKAGHWHALRGQNQNHAFTTGNMLSELAISNGSRAFVISTYRYEPDNYMSKAEELRPLAAVANPDGMVLVNFEPLRQKLYYKRFVDNLPPKFFELLFNADAALILGNEKSSGTEELDSAK